MELLELNSKDYNQYFPKTHQVFNSVGFNELNASKVDSVRYFVFKDSKVRLGICFGQKDNLLKNPFSAPFGGFSYNTDDHKFQTVEEAIALVLDFVNYEQKLNKETRKNLSKAMQSDFNFIKLESSNELEAAA